VLERPANAKNLFDFITEKGALDEELAVKFFRQIVTTIIACHRHGVVHRDLKDENLLVDLKTGKLSLIDFGVFIKEEEQAFTDLDRMHMYVPTEWICCARPTRPALPPSGPLASISSTWSRATSPSRRTRRSAVPS
jgi:serine/threonine protein kinase